MNFVHKIPFFLIDGFPNLYKWYCSNLERLLWRWGVEQSKNEKVVRVGVQRMVTQRVPVGENKELKQT